MKVIYVAGPIASSGELACNIRRACIAGVELMKAGACPLVPHTGACWGQSTYAAPAGRDVLPEVGRSGATWDDWMRVCLEMVRRSDAVLRLPGLSRGADLEVQEAASLGKPVFHNVGDAVRWARGHY